MSPALRMSLFFAVMFGTVGVHLPFWPVWLAGRGLSPADMGLVMATGLVVRGFTMPLIGSISDRAPDRRVVLVIASAVALLAGALFYHAQGIVDFMFATAVMTVGFGAVGPLAENQAMLLSSARQFDYGRVRALGSMGFVVCTVGAGYILAGRSPETVLAMVLAMVMLMLACSLALPAAPPGPPAARRGEIGPLLRQRPFLWLLLAVTLIQCSHAVLYAFGTLDMRRLGVGDGAIGVLWAVGVVAEIVLFWRGQHLLRRIDPVALLAIAGAGGVLRWSLMAMVTSTWGLALVQLLHAATFGCCHLSMMIILSRAVPVSHSATAQGLFASFCYAFGMGATMAAAGWLYAGFGPGAYYGTAVMAALGIGAGLMVGRTWDGEQLNLAR